MCFRLRRAFTLIELLLVLAILSLLMGLLLAAVQKAREAASRMQCQNHLRQIGLAAYQYHDSLHSFPAGMRYQNGTDPYPEMSWLTQVLPYVEQQPLWAEAQTAYEQCPSPLKNPPHIDMATVVPIFACPSDDRAADVHFAPRDKIQVALTSYLGVEGVDLHNPNGVLFRDSHVRIGDITDGTSQTLFAGERPASTDFQFGWWYAGAGQAFTGSADMVLGVQEVNILPYSWAPCFSGPYSFSPGKITNQCDMFHFWSLHASGANFLFADGSVHFLTYASAPLMPALASRAGQEVVSLIDY